MTVQDAMGSGSIVDAAAIGIEVDFDFEQALESDLRVSFVAAAEKCAVDREKSMTERGLFAVWRSL